MKKRTLIIISILASVAIIILLFLQLYWINSSLKISRKMFVNNANTAISNAIYKIEKLETAKSLRKKIAIYPKDSILLRSVDSTEKYLTRYYQYFPDSINMNNQGSKFKVQGSKSKVQSGKIKAELTREILDNLLNFLHFDLIENRINSRELDSILNIEFKNKGISAEYEYGVYSPKNQKLVIQKTGKYEKELLSSGLKFNLFPGDMFMRPAYLYIYFPHEKRYIMADMWHMFFISGLLVIILVFIFFYSVRIIVQQKKMSDMTRNMINNLTHEFKTPISTIFLACEVLNDPDMAKSETLYKSYVDVIVEENKRLSVMAENLLQSAVMEKGQLKLKKELLSIHNLIYDVIKNINMHIEKRNGILKTDFLAVNDKIYADKAHMTNVIYNLLDNADKYSPDNPVITIKTINIDEGIIISVSDTGIGISKNDQKKIFENLYRVPTGDIHDVKGFGLGLGYVKTVVEKHGGSVAVESELKKGTTFNIMFPFNQAN